MGLTVADLQSVAGLAAVVAIVVQLVKGLVPERSIPMVAVGVGALAAVGATLALGKDTAADVGNAVLTGLLAGAAAVGLYQVQRPIGVLPPKS